MKRVFAPFGHHFSSTTRTWRQKVKSKKTMEPLVSTLKAGIFLHVIQIYIGIQKTKSKKNFQVKHLPERCFEVCQPLQQHSLEIFSKANTLQTFKSIRKPVEGIAINCCKLLKFTVQRRNCSSWVVGNDSRSCWTRCSTVWMELFPSRGVLMVAQTFYLPGNS